MDVLLRLVTWDFKSVANLELLKVRILHGSQSASHRLLIS